jgi:ribosomal protein S18 acetylase RimI-like enzyme
VQYDVRIRAATPADVAAVLALHHADPARRALIAHLIGHEPSLVACEGARVVGFAGVRARHFFDRDFVELLFVGQADRRRGVGAALLDAVVSSPGTPIVFTSTNVSNAPMQALLARAGWVASGQVTGLDDGDDELFFRIAR